MKKKQVISLTIALAFTALGTTGVLLYFGLKPQAVTSIHVLFGLLFIGFVIFHIRNNWASLSTYTKSRKTSGLQKEFYLALALVLVIFLGAAFGLPPFSQIQHFGEDLTRGERPKGAFQRNIAFDDVSTNHSDSGSSIRFIIRKSNEALLPVMAVWVEDSAGQFIQNLFVPTKIMVAPQWAKDSEKLQHAIFDGELKAEPFGSASLPVWSAHKTDSTQNHDGPTPFSNFFLSTKTRARGNYSIKLEVKSGDVHELYEAAVDASRPGAVYALTAKEHSLLETAIVEVR